MTFCTGGMSSVARAQFFRQSAEICAAPHTSPCMALLMDPLAREGQARLPRCSSACGCITCFLLGSGPECCCPNIFAISSLTSHASHSRSCSFNSAFLSEHFGTSANSRRQGYRHSMAQDCWPRMAPSRLSAQAVAQWETASSCLSLSVRTMSRMAKFGSGLSSRGSLSGTGCELCGGW